jgi:hypothetical protein
LAATARRLPRLEDIEPITVAAYVEQHPGSPATIKQHMSAIRMLSSWLTEKGILAMNPAREVKTEKFSRDEGKTPAFETDQVQKVLDKIDTSNEVGLRDRALLGTLAYTFARIGAVVNLKVEDYFQTGKRSPPPEGPRYRYCKCGCDTQVYNPIAEVLSGRVTPELRHLQVSLGAQLSYRKAADLLRMLLPPVGGTTHTTTRARLITVGERIDQEIRQEITEYRKPDKLAKQMIIGIDGAFVKGRPPTDRANLEIISGRIEADAEPSKVFAVVRDQDGHAKQHVQALLRQSGRSLETKLRVVSDGEDGMRSLVGKLFNANEQHILDWYHISRRFEAIGKGPRLSSSCRGFPTPAVEALASLESREVENLARQLVRSQYRSEQLLRRSRYSRNDCGSGIRPITGRTGSRAAGRIMVVPDRKPDTTDQLPAENPAKAIAYRRRAWSRRWTNWWTGGWRRSSTCAGPDTARRCCSTRAVRYST